MTSKSKREKLKASVHQPFPPKKDNQAVSNGAADDAPTTPLTTRSSDVAVTMDTLSLSTGAPKDVASECSCQVPSKPITIPSGGSIISVHNPVLLANPTNTIVNTVEGLSPSANAPQTITLNPSSQVPSSGIFSNASHFSVHNPTMVDNLNNMTVNIGNDQRGKAMKLLSKHTIRGAAHDSSARSPPPRCHPGTRIEINDHIITWFYDEERQELLVWVYGPAGVGKSAIIQTLAEKLTESDQLGASVFVSRPNGRNSSRHLFLTIGYQLAVHIEEYCAYITEKLARDPELVDKGMEEQFQIFVVEPFVGRKIGAGAKPWGILLDGLDELDEHRSQKEIVRLIGDFVLKHPDVPLLWAIASRPEPHIVDTFGEEKVAPAYWKKHVPANSLQSSRDVERFLRDNLERIRKEFPRTVPAKWPSEGQFSRLAAGASGLFIFADTAVRFIEDPRYANPTTRLNQVISVLNGVTSTSHNQPFTHLDALYTSILNAIPPEVWPTTKRVLGALLYARGEGERQVLRKLEAISVVLGLDISTVYASVNGCYSLLNISDHNNAYIIPTTFHHTSFGDYLLDSTRSQSFYISLEDVEESLLKSSLGLWEGFKTNYPAMPGLNYQNRWLKYLSTLVSDAQPDTNFQYDIMWYIHEALFILLVEKHDLKRGTFSSKEMDQCFDLLSQLESATICDAFQDLNKLPEFLLWFFDIWEFYRDELVARGAIQEGRLEQVEISQIGACPGQSQLVLGKSVLQEKSYNMVNFHEILHDISNLKSCHPQLPVLVCGSLGNGCLLFRHQISAPKLKDYNISPSIPQTESLVWEYFTVPFPQSNFYCNTEHSLRTSFKTIQAKYSNLVPSTWPSTEQFLKFTSAVTHHPAFAPIAIRFIENPYSGNPITHLNQVLALIDEVDPSDDQPFIYVDALYTHILHSITSDMWPTAQQILGGLLHSVGYQDCSLNCAKGISIVFGIKLSVVYATFRNCYPIVLVPPEDPFLGYTTFCHGSFRHYLMDSTRSKEFYFSIKHSKDSILGVLSKVWIDFRKQCDGIPNRKQWNIYCSKYHSDASPQDDLMVINFNDDLLHDTHNSLFVLIKQRGPDDLESEQIRHQVFHILGQLDVFTVCRGFWWWNQREFVCWLFNIWHAYQAELASRGLVYEIQFQELQFNHLEWKSIHSHTLQCNANHGVQQIRGKNPQSEDEFEEYISGLQLFQRKKPQLEVLIMGTSGGQFALFEYEYTEGDLEEWLHYPNVGELKSGDLGYYIFPYQ